MIKSFEEFQSIGKDGFQAYAASATALTRGFQAMAQDAAEFSRKSFETSTAAVERATSAKSIETALEVQQGYAKDAYNAFIGQMSKMGDLDLNPAREAYTPFEASFQAFGAKTAGKQ